MATNAFDEARGIFNYFAEIMQYSTERGLVSWDPDRDRDKRTEYVLAAISLWSFGNGQYVFFDKKHLDGVVQLWRTVKELDEDQIGEWIRLYEERAKQKGKLAEIGERFVDFSSSYYSLPFCFSVILEYEASPYWGAIIHDFRKLLTVMAPLKIGIFHLPKLFRTSEVYVQDLKTGKISWEKKVLDGEKPDELIEDMKIDLAKNQFENPHTVYLIVLIHLLAGNLKMYGYLLWREADTKVRSEKLEPYVVS